MIKNNPTICALATARINSAIHIIRISGIEAFNIINKIIDKPIPKTGFRIFKRLIIDKDEVVDDVLISAFVSPKSYTGEDTIEINCHGGVLVSDQIIKLLIRNGCSLAERGEFTKRSFLNKKISLLQSEAVNNLIHAKSNIALKGSINSLLGKSMQIIETYRNKLFDLIGQIEVNIDYPEYQDIEEITIQEAENIINEIILNLKPILINSKRYIPITSGIKVMILGQPNVGKSTLLNSLTNTDRAIISDIPGTTRDILEASVVIDNVTLNIYDTAGIRQTDDKLEALGIEKAKSLLKEVDLVLLLKPANEYNDYWINEYKDIISNKPFITVYTKKDLLNNNLNLLENEVLINAKNNDINSLIKKIKTFFEVEELENSDLNVLQSNHQIAILERIICILENTIKKLNYDPLDLLIEDFNLVLDDLNKLLGIDVDYEFLTELFNKFCLGK